MIYVYLVVLVSLKLQNQCIKSVWGEEVEDTGHGKSIDYIIGRKKKKIPFINRFSFLPKDLYNIFNTSFKVSTGIIKTNQYNFLSKYSK